jgi:histidine ammonia-lyase
MTTQSKRKAVFLIIGMVCIGLFTAAAYAKTDHIILDGKSLTVESIINIADGAAVSVTDEAYQRVKESNEVLLQAAREGQPIYGFTVGVGWNKDESIINPDGSFTPKLIQKSIKFNKSLIRAHCGGVGPDLDARTVRAMMAVRLNMILDGSAGIQPGFIQIYLDFLNKNIIPSVPSRGSVGEADITIVSQIALAMIGEGDVYVNGSKTSAKKALRNAGIQMIEPYAKDALSIFSNNSYSLALAAFALSEIKQLQYVQKLVYALSLEGLNGNVAPFLSGSMALRRYHRGEQKLAAALRAILEGSSLWNKSEERALQDPLSFRDAQWMMSVMEMNIKRMTGGFSLQINLSDDNPGTSIAATTQSDLYAVKQHYLKNRKGALFPTSNFEPLPWVFDFEAAAIAVSHNSNASALRITKLGMPQFTQLARFLGTENTIHAFGAMQKPVTALMAENRYLANPASLDTYAIAGDIEDVATNAPFVVEKLRRIIDNHFHILGIELMHAAQAIDLRKQKNPMLTLGKQTKPLFRQYRKIVPFLDNDRPFTPYFRKSARFLKMYGK